MASIATMAVLGLLVGASPAVGAIFISSGPTYSPGGSWSCTTPVAGSEKLAGGATYSCSGTAGAFSNLYIGIKNNNVPSGTVPIGDKMNSSGGSEPTGSEIFSWSGDGVSSIVYTGSTSISSFGTVFLRHTLSFTGTGSLIDDATTQALSNANGAVRSLWRIGPAVSSMTVNSLIEASTSSSGPWTAADTFFGTTSSHRQGTGSTEVDKSHVDIGFYTSSCGDGTLDTNFSAEQCETSLSGTACCNANCTFKASTTSCRGSAGQCDLQENCTGSSATCPTDIFKSAATACTGASQGGACDNDPADHCTGSSNVCVDVLKASTVSCRGSAGQCDVAENCTGSSSACPANTFASAATACTGASQGGACDNDPADHCTGSSNVCVDVLKASTVSCRGSAGQCDVAENCTGSSSTCPADVFQSAATPCTGASQGGACDDDAADHCTGSSNVCVDVLQASTVTCRPSAGDCDVAENCTGSSSACPTDDFVSSATTCRGSAGFCDVIENCTGTSATCPADTFEASTVTCRAAVDECDAVEQCTGSGPNCPADDVLPSTTPCNDDGNVCTSDECDGSSIVCQHPAGNTGAICRAAVDSCDVDETCDGTATCPTDAMASSGFECRAAAGDCDVAETCTGASNACPADVVVPASTACASDGNPCTVDECDGSSGLCQHPAGNSGANCRNAISVCDVTETCDGSSTTCPADGFAASTVPCRAAVNVCDVAEDCTGTSATCPANAVSPSTVQCRAAAGPCDVAENCNGVNLNCPADAFASSTTSCRAAATVCDVAENCTGASAACPADQKAPTTTVCRGSGGGCDVVEHCDGSTNTCPADSFALIGTSCRAAAGSCDVAEVCTGLSAACPADVFLPNSTPCNDANTCTTGDACQSGVCVGNPVPTACVDHFLCYKTRQASFSTTGVTLMDEFDTAIASLTRTRYLCTPAEKNAEPVLDNVTHLKAYKVKPNPAHNRQTNVVVIDQFTPTGIHVDTTKADLLFVPAAKNLSSPPSAPANNSHNVDHYECYKVRITKGTAKFPRGVTAMVADQFTSPAKNMAVKKPKHLCSPVSVNGQTIKTSAGHLLCYRTSKVRGQPKHIPVTAYVADEFIPGSTQMTTKREAELCVPAVIAP